MVVLSTSVLLYCFEFKLSRAQFVSSLFTSQERNRQIIIGS